MALELKYCKTLELDLEELLRVIISICHHHKSPCEANVTIKLNDYPNPVTMVLSEGKLPIFDVSQQRELLLAFVKWIKEDDMLQYDDKHLVDWFIKNNL